MKILQLKPVVRKPLGFSLLITVVMILLTTVYFFLAQPVLPLFYSLALPEQQLVPKLWLFTVPVLSLAITVVNIILLHIFKEYDDLILALFGNATIIMQFLLLLAIIRIMYLTI